MRLRPEIFDFDPNLGLKLSQTEPTMPSTVPTNRHTKIPNAAPKSYEFIRFGAIHGPKPYEFIGFGPGGRPEALFGNLK